MARSKTALVFFLMTLLALPQTANASLLDLLHKKDQPAQQYPIQDDAAFNANTKSFRQIPFNDPKLEFDIMLPNDWKSEPVIKTSDQALKQDIPEDIARFKSPRIGTAQAVVTIQSKHLAHEISAENWLRNYAVTNGYTPQEKVTADGNKKATISYISVFEQNSTYTYARVQINGDIVEIARFEVPLYLREPMGFLQKKSIDSFRLIQTNDDPVEQQREYSLSDAVRFTYPESWEVHYPDFKDSNSMSVQIHNEAQSRQVDGLIRFVAVRRRAQTSLAQELETLKKYFNETLGLEIKKMVSSGDIPAAPRFLFSRYELYQVASKKKSLSEQDLRLVALGDKEWYIFVFLLSPSEADNLYAWARNTQTFDLVVKSLK